MAKTIKMYQNDTSPNLSLVVTRSGGTVVNLTECIVRFRIQDTTTGNITNPDPYDVCIISDPPNGVCEYQWNVGDLPDPGTYIANLQITFPTVTPEDTSQVETAALLIQVASIV